MAKEYAIGDTFHQGKVNLKVCFYRAWKYNRRIKYVD